MSEADLRLVYITQSPVPILIGEKVAYSISTTGIGSGTGLSGVTATGVVLYTATGGASTGTLSGNASVSGQNIITPKVIPLTAGFYTLKVPATIDGNTVLLLCDFRAYDPVPPT